MFQFVCQAAAVAPEAGEPRLEKTAIEEGVPALGGRDSVDLGACPGQGICAGGLFLSSLFRVPSLLARATRERP